MKKLFTIILLAVLGFASTGCDNYLDVNKNVDAPDYIEGYLYLPGVESALGVAYYDIRATSALAQVFATTGYSSYANHFYTKRSDACGELWKLAYFTHGINLENMINQSLSAKDWALAGIGYAIKAYTWDQLTKEHGDVILKQSFIAGMLSQQYDYQKDVYPQIREWAKTAIKYLEMPDETNQINVVKNDMIYHGDKAKWIKFAHGIIVRNLASLTNKSDFVASYSQELIDHAALAIQSNDDNCTVACPGGGPEAQFNDYNNFWGVQRGNLPVYYNSTFAVEIMTGTLPLYDHTTGNKVKRDTTGLGESDDRAAYYPYELNPTQYVADTMLFTATGHFDPRVIAKLGTRDGYGYENIDNADSVKHYHFYGSNFGSGSGPIGTASNPFGTIAGGKTKPETDGEGRWIYRNNAPYIFMTAAEIKFELAECYWKKGDKAAALQAFKEGVRLDMDFTKKYLVPGNPKSAGGDKISTSLFQTLANEYLQGPYVDGLSESDFTLSHIMLQKFVALYPWGSLELWTDQRKYNYDLVYTGDYPSLGNGYELTYTSHKWDEDPTKVFKGLYLQPAQVEGRGGTYNVENNGSPCYRIRPRYNSEYVWNLKSLGNIKPIAGTADDYQTSIPWFAYPNEVPGVEN